MKKIVQDSVLLTEDEYAELSNPDKCYTLLTKTKASKLVVRLLKADKQTCWNDTGEDYEDGCCSYCTVLYHIG